MKGVRQQGLKLAFPYLSDATTRGLHSSVLPGPLVRSKFRRQLFHLVARNRFGGTSNIAAIARLLLFVIDIHGLSNSFQFNTE